MLVGKCEKYSSNNKTITLGIFGLLMDLIKVITIQLIQLFLEHAMEILKFIDIFITKNVMIFNKSFKFQ